MVVYTKSFLRIGKRLTRFPVAANTAFATAGPISGVPASPSPPGDSGVNLLVFAKKKAPCPVFFYISVHFYIFSHVFIKVYCIFGIISENGYELK